MALAELLRSLEQEAEVQAAAVRAEARATADGIRAERAAELARRSAALRDARARDLEAAAARELEASRRESTRLVLEARAAALERVRRRAEQRLAATAADPGAVPLLARDLAVALEYLGPAPVVVEAPAPLLEALRGATADTGRMTFVPADNGRHGLVVRSADGAVAVDASRESRLARAWPRLAIELARRLEALA
jgi:vacuolar-type H+-ATPase subunit E/Vma4